MDTELPLSVKNQYIETLIRLIELNKDHYWLDAFLKLRTGGFLPGGGAGSLNDWGPGYNGIKADAWYGQLYNIMRDLFDHSSLPKKLLEYSTFHHVNQVQVIRCLTCQKSHQHPRIFEAHLAIKFYREALPQFVDEDKLPEILNPELSFNSPDVLNYRAELLKGYAACGITVYDFLFADYICPHCNDLKPETEHDLYRVYDESIGIVKLEKV